jgi:3D (Asp-Asp-Asp) domain-containing protein
MRKTTKVLTLTSLALFSSNIIMGTSYVIDKHNYQKQIVDKNDFINEIHSKRKEDLLDRQKTIDDLNKSIKEQSTTIRTLQQQLENATKTNESPMRQLMEISAYTAGYESTQKQKGDKGYGLTASGTYVEEGRTIACPPSFEFGTKLNIEGIGLRICEDRGGAIKSGHLDLYMDSLNAAIEFGRKTLMVEILS